MAKNKAKGKSSSSHANKAQQAKGAAKAGKEPKGAKGAASKNNNSANQDRSRSSTATSTTSTTSSLTATPERTNAGTGTGTLQLAHLPPRALQSLALFLLGPRPSPVLHHCSSPLDLPSPLPLAFTCKRLHDLVFSTQQLWLTPTPRSLLLCPGSSLVWHPPVSTLPDADPWPSGWQPWSIDLARFTRVEYVALLRRAHASIRNKVAHIQLPAYATTTDSFRPAALLSLVLHSGAFPSLCAVSVPYWTLRGLARWEDVSLVRLQHPVRLIVEGHPPAHAVPSFDALLDAWVERMQPFLDALVQAAAAAAAAVGSNNGVPLAHASAAAHSPSTATAKLALPHIPTDSPFLSWSKCRSCRTRYASPSPCTPVDPELMSSPASIKSYPAASPKGQLDARDPSVTLAALNQLYHHHYQQHQPQQNDPASCTLLPPPTRCEHFAHHANNAKPRPTTRLLAASSPATSPPSHAIHPHAQHPTNDLSAAGLGASRPSPWSSPCCALIARGTCYACLYRTESLAQQCVHCYAVLCEDHMVLDRYDCIHCGALIEQYACPACYTHLPRHTITCVDCGEALCEACIDEAYPCTSCDQLLCLECAEHMLSPVAAAAAAGAASETDDDGPPPLLPNDQDLAAVSGQRGGDADTESSGAGGVGPADHQSESAAKVMCLDCSAYVRALHEAGAYALGPDLPEAVLDEDDDDVLDDDTQEPEDDHAACDHCRAAALAPPPPPPASGAAVKGKAKQPVYIEVQHYDDDGKLIETKTTQYMVDKATIDSATKRVQAATGGKMPPPAASGNGPKAGGKQPAASGSKSAAAATTNGAANNKKSAAAPTAAQDAADECTCPECVAYRQKEHQAMAVLKAMMAAGGPPTAASGKPGTAGGSRKPTPAQAAAAKAAGLSPAEAQAFVDRLNLAMEELSAASLRVAAAQQPAATAGSGAAQHDHGDASTAAAAAAAAAMMSGDLPPAIAAMLESVGSRIGAAAAAAATGPAPKTGGKSTGGAAGKAQSGFQIGDAAWNAMIASVPLPPYSTATATDDPAATLTAASMEDLFADPDTFGSVLARLAVSSTGANPGSSSSSSSGLASGSVAFGPMPPSVASGGVMDPTAGVIGFGGFVDPTDGTVRQIPGEFFSMARRAMKDVLRDFITSGSTAPASSGTAGSSSSSARGLGKHAGGK